MQTLWSIRFVPRDTEPLQGLVKLYGTSTTASIDLPLPTVTAGGNHLGLCEPFIVQTDFTGGNGSYVRDINRPLPTITTRNSIGLCEPFLVQLDHTKSEDSRLVHNVKKPMPTITTADAMALVEPFIVKYYGTGGATSIHEPLDTITTRDRFLLVMPDGSKARLDFRFRMLQPHELAAAMGFPPDYQFCGNREERVKQIGNAVPVGLAEAHCHNLIHSIHATN